MNRVQQKIYDEVVRPGLDSMAGLTVGEVVETDPRNHLVVAKAKINEEGAEEQLLPPAPIATINGLKTTDFYTGDKVLIGFIQSSYRHPFIVSKIDMEYALDTREKESHFRKGSNITDFYSDREGEDWDVE